MSELSPAARAVLKAAAVSACLAEWGSVNDPPCHPGDEDWNGCHLCVKRDLIAAALRALAAFDEEVQIRKASGMAEFDLVVRVSRINAIATEIENADD